MKFTVALILLGISCSQALDLDIEWENFKTKFERNYLSAQEHDDRKQIFASNLDLIEKHNAEEARGLHSFKLGVNKFADLTNKEFNDQYSGTLPLIDDIPRSKVEPMADLPKTKDWRDEGAVTPVKNQGQCGSCWSFGTTGAIEGSYFIKTGKLVSLSEQNLVDCSKMNNGCFGGLQYLAMEYVIDNGGIDTEESYPYTPEQGKCRYNPDNIGATITGYQAIEKGSEDDLYNAVGGIAPVTVGIDASHYSFQLYHSGVYTEYYCSSTQLTHAVLVVGYGHEGGRDYWLVKNSWGEDFGQEGYIKMARNHNNMCGIASLAVYAIA